MSKKNTKKNSTNNENRIMWQSCHRPQCTKNLVEKKRHDDKKYKKNYINEY